MCYNFSIEHFTIMKQRVRETLSVTMNINRHGVKIFKSKVSFYMQSIRFFLVFFFSCMYRNCLWHIRCDVCLTVRCFLILPYLVCCVKMLMKTRTGTTAMCFTSPVLRRYVCICVNVYYNRNKLVESVWMQANRFVFVLATLFEYVDISGSSLIQHRSIASPIWISSGWVQFTWHLWSYLTQ